MIRFLFLLSVSFNLSAQTVYKTPSGLKYHLSSCRMVKNVSSSLSLNQALQSGLTSCGICKPPVRQTLGIISKPKKTAGVNSENQCYGKTQKGLRCKRTTRIGNNFCFQHIPQ